MITAGRTVSESCLYSFRVQQTAVYPTLLFPAPTLPRRYAALSRRLWFSAADFTRAVADAPSRRQVLNARTHKLITGFEEEVKAKEEEAARVKAEEERAVREAEEEAKREEEQLLAKEAAAAEEEAQRVKDEEELKAKEVEEAAAKMKEEEEERKAKKDAKEAEEKSKAEEGESAKQAEAAAASEETRSARDVDVPSPGDRDVEQDAAAEAQDGEAKR